MRVVSRLAGRTSKVSVQLHSSVGSTAATAASRNGRRRFVHNMQTLASNCPAPSWQGYGADGSATVTTVTLQHGATPRSTVLRSRNETLYCTVRCMWSTDYSTFSHCIWLSASLFAPLLQFLPQPLCVFYTKCPFGHGSGVLSSAN